MANVKNILVGAADVWITGIGQAQGDNVPSVTTNQRYAAALASDSKWRNMGFTTEGLELSYEPDYGDVVVDQLLDSARIFKQGLKVMLKTSFSEATLENLQVSFGQDDSVVNSAGSNVYALNVNSSSANTTLNIAAGGLGTAPVERSIVAIGNAPQSLGTAGQASGYGGTYDSSSVKKERVYIARRVVSMETVAHGLKRTDATVFPVTFRCLPDTANGGTDGSEYGKIIDRVYG